MSTPSKTIRKILQLLQKNQNRNYPRIPHSAEKTVEAAVFVAATDNPDCYIHSAVEVSAVEVSAAEAAVLMVEH